jgi:tetratricopeptide (TPR) repeat protein
MVIWERLAREHPESPDNASGLGATLNNMALIDLDAKRFAQARGRLEQAITWQKRGLAANPRHRTYRQFLRNHLTSLIRAANSLGNTDEARSAQRELDELAATDPARVGLDQRIAAVVRGEAPKDNRERVQTAYRAYEKRLYPASTRLLGEALEADPKLGDDREAQHRYNGACSTVLAAGATTTPALPSPMNATHGSRSGPRSTRSWPKHGSHKGTACRGTRSVYRTDSDAKKLRMPYWHRSLATGSDDPRKPTDRPAFAYDTRGDFRGFDPHYRDKKNAAYERLRKLQAEMIAQQRRGRQTPCTFPRAEEVRNRVRSKIRSLGLDDSDSHWAARLTAPVW